MRWRAEAAKYFPTVVLEPHRRASVPTGPSSGEKDEAGTLGTLARQAGEEYDAHVAEWMDREERAAILEFDGGYARRAAERAAGLN